MLTQILYVFKNASAIARIFKGSPGRHKNTRGPVTTDVLKTLMGTLIPMAEGSRKYIPTLYNLVRSLGEV